MPLALNAGLIILGMTFLPQGPPPNKSLKRHPNQTVRFRKTRHLCQML